MVLEFLHQQSKLMITQRIIIFNVFLLFSFCIMSQENQEAILLKKIEEISQTIGNQKLDNEALKPFIKELKKTAKKSGKDLRLKAVTNAVIGKTLNDKNYHEAAVPFFKKAYKFRKKEGAYLPQRWAINELINNGLQRNDLKSSYKYAKKWMNLTSQDPKKLEPIYQYNRSGEQYFSTEINNIIRRIYPVYIPRRMRGKINNWEERKKYSLAILRYNLKKFPSYQDDILFDLKGYSEYVIRKYLKEEKGEVAEEYANDLLKILSKTVPLEKQTALVKTLSSFFKKVEGYWPTAPKTTDYEMVGIRLMEDYIKKSKKIKNYKQVLYGYRHIAVRYQALQKYDKSVQYLAEAISYAHEFNLPKEIVKSYGGLQQMMQNLKKENDIKGIELAKAWKVNYKTKKIPQENIDRFDEILFLK